VGGKKTLVEEEERVTSESALFAPVAASISIGILYLLINSGINPAALYAAGVTLFGGLAISDIGVPILRNVLPEGFASGKVKVPKKVSDSFGLVDEELPLDGLVTLLLGLSFTAAYWSPFAMEQKFLVSNFIAWALAMTSLGAISLGSFQTAAILLAGLFAYDIFWVFGTPVMMTVATKVEAPVKFLYTAPPLLEGAEPREYPFSVLGLGDVVIPGLFVRFMTKLDTALQPQTIGYFNGATAAYALGLSACFVVNEITHSGQPALLYLDPACIGSALAVGALNGQLADVWNFEEPENE
jgi:minor histocompatibility antigen H13